MTFFDLVEAAIGNGNFEYTLYLGDESACSTSSECLPVCKGRSATPELVTGARCTKFAGNLKSYCCCYFKSTRACCNKSKNGFWFDCLVTGPEVLSSAWWEFHPFVLSLKIWQSTVSVIRNGRNKQKFHGQTIALIYTNGVLFEGCVSLPTETQTQTI